MIDDSVPTTSPEVGPAHTGPGPDDAETTGSRRIHGGMPLRPDDEALEERVKRERAVVAGLPYDPDEVPPATDAEPVVDVQDTPEYQEELAEVRRQREAGELVTGKVDTFPPTRYDRT